MSMPQWVGQINERVFNPLLDESVQRPAGFLNVTEFLQMEVSAEVRIGT